MGDPEQRISDAEREQAVVWLRGDLLSGRLALEEFSERIEQAYAARVRADLERVRSGLPSIGESSAGQPRRHATRLTAGLFAHVVKRGRLKLRRWTVAGGALCDIDLDLRKAEIHGQKTAVSIVVILGNVDVYVPENINASVTGLALGGHRREWGEDLERPGAPEITVRAISVFGTVDVWRVPADMPGDYGEVTRQLQGRQRELPP
ncbi:MAG: DUF1707 domain-containing protein [Solirubrobacteraceae bacterium]